MNRDTVTLVAWAMVILWPFLGAATLYVWRLHGKSRRLDTRVPKPRWRLSLTLAVTSTLGFLGATVLAAASVFYLSGRIDLTQRLADATLLTYIILILIPIINAGYLRLLEAQGGESVQPSQPS